MGDNAYFGAPLRATFALDYLHMMEKYLPNTTTEMREAYKKYFQLSMCLAEIDYDKKEFRCINRNPVDVRKNRADGSLAKYKQLFATYEIPRPGNFAVIMHPVLGFGSKGNKT